MIKVLPNGKISISNVDNGNFIEIERETALLILSMLRHMTGMNGRLNKEAENIGIKIYGLTIPYCDIHSYIRALEDELAKPVQKTKVVLWEEGRHVLKDEIPVRALQTRLPNGEVYVSLYEVSEDGNMKPNRHILDIKPDGIEIIINTSVVFRDAILRRRS